MKKLIQVLATGLIFASAPWSDASAQINSFPHMEDFESFNTCTGSCNSPCTLNNGWTNEQGGGDGGEWITDENGTSSSSTGPSVDYNPGTSTGNYLYYETSSPCYSNVTAYLYSPSVDMTSVGGLNMVFAWHMYGSSQGTLSIDVSADGGATWTQNLWSASGDNGDVWETDTVDLSAYAGSIIIVRFDGLSSTSFTSDMAIDDILFYEPLALDAGIAAVPSPGLPSCNLSNAPVTATFRNYGLNDLVSCDVDWSVNGVAQTGASWTGTLTTGQDSTISLGTYSFVDGDVLKVWTSSPNAGTEVGSGPQNDTLTFSIQSGLSGTYTIGTGGDYTTWNDAAADLAVFGVCGAVIFDVMDGTYNEQMSLGDISGSSSVNTITFRSMNGDPSLVTLTYAATMPADNYVVQLSGADYVTFEDLTLMANGITYSIVVDVNGESHWNTFDGNHIMGDPTTLTTSTNKANIVSFTGSNDNNNRFIDNDIQYGSYGLYWYGINTTSREYGTIIEGNDIHNMYYRGVHLYYHDSVIMNHNDIQLDSAYTGTGYAVYNYYNWGPCEIMGNTVTNYTYGYGMYLSNQVASASNRGYIANNMIYVGRPLSTSTSYGIYHTTVSNYNVVFNSINMESQGTSSRCVYWSGGTNNYMKNNVMANSGPGYGIYYLSGLAQCDYNDYYVPMGTVGYFSANMTTLADWQNSSAFDGNSYDMNPWYLSRWDLHTCGDSVLDGNAEYDPMVMYDIDGQMRDTNGPDIGADEFLGLLNFGFADDSIWTCDGVAATLGGWQPADDATYVWSTNETTSSIQASNAGTYSVLVTTACGNTVADVVVATIPDANADFNVQTSFLTGIFTNASSGTITSTSWDFGDGSSSSDLDPVHVYTTPGTYVVTLTVTGPCGTDTYTDTMVASVVGIDEQLLEGAVEVFPNPNSGNFTVAVELPSSMAVTMDLVNVQGQSVWSQQLGTVNGTVRTNVNMEAEANGIYFLRIVADDHVAVRKVVLEK